MTISKLAGNAADILAESGTTILILLVVVFSALIVLTFIFWLFGKIFGRSKGDKKKVAPSAPPPKAAPAKAAVPVNAVKAPVVQDGISEEVVAAIAAAVACMAPEGKKYALRSVTRTHQGRPVWAAAGLTESTRPF